MAKPEKRFRSNRGSNHSGRKLDGAAGVDGTGQPLQPTAMMCIGSITKTFAAAELMLLGDRGMVDLNAPVSDYVSLPFSSKPTVRQTMGMLSGFPDLDYDAVTDAALADPERVWTGQEVLDGVPAGAPGLGSTNRAVYNSLNFIVLGMVIEKVTGRTFADVVRADLLDPAQLGSGS